MKAPLIQALPRYLNTLPAKIYTLGELGEIISDFSQAINTPLDTDPETYITYLVQQQVLHQIKFATSTGNIPRILIGQPSVYEIALSLKKDSYLSHLTAAQLHGLVKTTPTNVYISTEKAERSKQASSLGQAAIDAAFAKPQRHSATELVWNGIHFALLSAQYTAKAGISTKGPLTYTCLERTLIDMAVRPSYGGGSKVVLQAYHKALPFLSIDKLVALIRQIDFIYPYSHSVGFYLMKAGCSRSPLAPLKAQPIRFRFYVDYAMSKTAFDAEWQVYYPPGLSL